jgi:hypothetical protein
MRDRFKDLGGALELGEIDFMEGVGLHI